jgi:hypothetical protein
MIRQWRKNNHLLQQSANQPSSQPSSNRQLLSQLQERSHNTELPGSLNQRTLITSSPSSHNPVISSHPYPSLLSPSPAPPRPSNPPTPNPPLPTRTTSSWHRATSTSNHDNPQNPFSHPHQFNQTIYNQVTRPSYINTSNIAFNPHTSNNTMNNINIQSNVNRNGIGIGIGGIGNGIGNGNGNGNGNRHTHIGNIASSDGNDAEGRESRNSMQATQLANLNSFNMYMGSLNNDMYVDGLTVNETLFIQKVLFIEGELSKFIFTAIAYFFFFLLFYLVRTNQWSYLWLFIPLLVNSVFLLVFSAVVYRKK